MDKQTQRQQKKTARRLARRAKIDTARENLWEYKPRQRLAPDVYLPFSGSAAPEEVAPTMAPEWLLASETPEPRKPKHILEEVDYTSVRRLDMPIFVVSDYVLSLAVEQILAGYSKLAGYTPDGSYKCRLCNNTGVSRWRARGAAAQVCKCVRHGASIREFQATVAARG